MWALIWLATGYFINEIGNIFHFLAKSRASEKNVCTRIQKKMRNRIQKKMRTCIQKKMSKSSGK